jgi:hypothetical protein
MGSLLQRHHGGNVARQGFRQSGGKGKAVSRRNDEEYRAARRLSSRLLMLLMLKVTIFNIQILSCKIANCRDLFPEVDAALWPRSRRTTDILRAL